MKIDIYSMNLNEVTTLLGEYLKVPKKNKETISDIENLIAYLKSAKLHFESKEEDE